MRLFLEYRDYPTCTGGVQNIQSTLQPIVEALEQYKPKVEEIGQVLLHVSVVFQQLKNGRCSVCLWDYMTEEFVDEIVDSENINKTLREQMLGIDSPR